MQYPRQHLAEGLSMFALYGWKRRASNGTPARPQATSRNTALPSRRRTAFFDEHAIQFFDPDHSQEEDRFLLLGMSFKLRVVVVCRCFRESETAIRLISARKADEEEEAEYWRQR